MTGPFVLEFYKPDPMFLTPQGGSTYLPLTGDWLKGDNVTRYGVAFSVSDTDTFDFGSQLPNLIVSKSLSRFGDKIQRFTLKDRAFKCSVYALGDTLALAKLGIQGIQNVCTEATQYTASGNMNDGLGDTDGTFFFLKYQPDSTTSAVYFRVLSGFVDLSPANDMRLLNNNMMKVNLNLRISFAGYGPAVWLQNLQANGTCVNSFAGYAATGPSLTAFAGPPTVPGPGNVNLYYSIPGPNGVAGGVFNTFAPFYGVDTAWGVTPIPPATVTSDVWSGWSYNAGNQAGSDIVYTPESPVYGTYHSFTAQYVWLAFEYTDNAAAGSFCTAQLQVWNTDNGTGAWYNSGTAIVPTNNTGSARYAWGAAIDTSLNPFNGSRDPRFTCKFRVAFTFDRNRSFATKAIVRKVALWAFPAVLPSAMVALPTEYVSQAQNMTQSTYITSIQGNAETPVRVKLSNPIQMGILNSANTVIFQRAYIGARKYHKFPFRFFYKYATSNTAVLPNGTQYVQFAMRNDNTHDDVTATVGIPVPDLRARQYRVLARMNTTATTSQGIQSRGTNLPNYTLVPNGSYIEIPSTGGATQTLDSGVATVPPYNAQHTDEGLLSALNFGPQKVSDWYIGRSLSSPTGSITITANGLWLIPTDQYMDIDTRAQDLVTNYDTTAWSNFSNTGQMQLDPAYSMARELIINTMFRTAPGVHLGNSGEFDSGSVAISPAYTGTGFSFLPATPSSPEPMQFCAVIRRQGASGAPAADVTETDPIGWAFLYMPAWEF